MNFKYVKAVDVEDAIIWLRRLRPFDCCDRVLTVLETAATWKQRKKGPVNLDSHICFRSMIALKALDKFQVPVLNSSSYPLEHRLL